MTCSSPLPLHTSSDHLPAAFAVLREGQRGGSTEDRVVPGVERAKDGSFQKIEMWKTCGKGVEKEFFGTRCSGGEWRPDTGRGYPRGGEKWQERVEVGSP